MAIETGVNVASGLSRALLVDAGVEKIIAGLRERVQVRTRVHGSLSCFQANPAVFRMGQIHVEKTARFKGLAQYSVQYRLKPFGCKAPVDRPVLHCIV